MVLKLDQKGWYDGWFYARLIDSDMISIRDRLFPYIEHNRTVLDVGCGTGGFAMRLASVSKQVTGIDISGKQIHQAHQRLKKSGKNNVRFVHGTATDLSQFDTDSFDYAIMIFMLHEIGFQERLAILKEVSRVSRKIVILDYNYPMGRNFAGRMIRLIEYLAGKDHFTNFSDFNLRGGLPGLIESAGMKIVEKRSNGSQTLMTMVAEL